MNDVLSHTHTHTEPWICCGRFQCLVYDESPTVVRAVGPRDVEQCASCSLPRSLHRSLVPVPNPRPGTGLTRPSASFLFLSLNQPSSTSPSEYRRPWPGPPWVVAPGRGRGHSGQGSRAGLPHHLSLASADAVQGGLGSHCSRSTQLVQGLPAVSSDSHCNNLKPRGGSMRGSLAAAAPPSGRRL